MSGRSRRSSDDHNEGRRVRYLIEDATTPSEHMTRSRSLVRATRRSIRRAAASVAARSRSRSENRPRRSDSAESSDTESSRQASSDRQFGATATTGPGSILAGVESHLLLLRRSLLLLSHLARPSAVQFLEDKPPAPPTSSAFIDSIPECRINCAGVECSICLAKFRRGTKASVLPCKHQFHNKCIRPWLKKKNSCPLCRYELPSDEPTGNRRIDPTFLDMYDDFNSFSEAIRATRTRVILTQRNEDAESS